MAKGKYEEWLRPDNLLKIEGWARDGLTDEQIAKNIGISKDTFYKWKSRFSDFSDALKKNKEIADREVENALYKRALGYMVVEKKTTVGDNGSKIETFERHIPGDITAQIFWLKNRKPKQWRERQEYEVNLDALNKAAEILGGIADVIND